MATAGITIWNELKKYGAIPSHWLPVHAPFQALLQASKFKEPGRDKSVPVRISSTSFRDVSNMTIKGAKYTAAIVNRPAYSTMRKTLSRAEVWRFATLLMALTSKF
jgi:hypothetical protein